MISTDCFNFDFCLGHSVQPLELFQVADSHLVLIQSKGPASPRNPRHCKAWATPPQGQPWVSEHSEGHVLKSLSSGSLLHTSGIKACGMNNSKSADPGRRDQYSNLM